MDIQFAFGNPIHKGKKRVAKRKKHPKLKVVRRKSSKRGVIVAKRKRKSKSRKPARRSKHRGPVHHKRKRRTKRNPQKFVYTKKSPNTGKTMRDSSGSFFTPSERKQLGHRIGSLLKKAGKSKSKSVINRLTKKAEALKNRLRSSAKKEDAAIRELSARQEDGWKGDVKHTSMRKKKSKKRSGAKKGAKYVAKKKKKSKKAKRAAARRARKAAAKKSKAAKKASKAPKRRKSRRKSSKRRKRAKTYAHRHSRKIAHVAKGTSFSGKVYTRGKGRKRHKASVRFRFINPLGGAKMNANVKEYTGLEMRDVGALAVGGALYTVANGVAKKLLNMVSPQIATTLTGVPVVGPAVIPLLFGVLLHKFGGKIPQKQAAQAAEFIGEGLIAAAVVGVGVSVGQKYVVPNFPATMMAGVMYTPMSGVPQLGAVKYYPGMNGVPQLGAVKYYPGMSGIPQLGKDPDFGKDSDYGGSGGYTESHKFSSSDFGAADDAAEDGSLESEINNNMGVMG